MNEQNDGESEHGHEKVLSRILSLSDGIFAFAITLLILYVVVPQGTTSEELPSALVKLWPQYLSFLISFLVIGAYWVNHVRQLHFLTRYSYRLIWINLLFLLFVVMIPFSTNLLSDFQGPLPVIIYAINIACAGFTSTALWAYATHKHRLVNADLGSKAVRRGIILSLVSPVVFTLSIGIAMADRYAAQYSWISIVIINLVLQRIYKLPKADENI